MLTKIIVLLVVSVTSLFAAKIEYPIWETMPPTHSVYTPSDASWATLFNDPILNALLELSETESPDLASAQEKLNYAKAVSDATGTSRFPLVQATAYRADQSTESSVYNFPYTQYGLTGSYELDLFRKNWNKSASGKFNYKAEKERYHLAKVLLTHHIVSLYARLRAAEKTVLLTEHNLALFEETQDLIQLQQNIGEANQLDVERSNSFVQQTKSHLAITRHNAQRSRLVLAALVGKTLPQLNDILDTPQGIPNSTTLPLLDTPLDIILQRPDVAAAENQLKAAKKGRLAAMGNWLPNISLSGFYGNTDQLDSDFEDIWTTQLSVSFNLIDFGKLESQVKAASAQEKEALAQYKKTTLMAISEIESAISEYNARTEALTALRLAKQSANQALTLSTSLYNLGEIDFLDLLDAERTLINADLSEIDAELNQVLALTQLYKSVGLK